MRRRPRRFRRHGFRHGGERGRGLARRAERVAILGQEKVLRHDPPARAPMHSRPLAPTWKQPDTKLFGQGGDAILPRAHPLSSVIDEGSVIEVAGQRPSADAVLCFKNQHVRTGGRQQSCRVKTRKPAADYDHIARALRGHVTVLQLLKQV